MSEGFNLSQWVRKETQGKLIQLLLSTFSVNSKLMTIGDGWDLDRMANFTIGAPFLKSLDPQILDLLHLWP